VANYPVIFISTSSVGEGALGKISISSKKKLLEAFDKQRYPTLISLRARALLLSSLLKAPRQEHTHQHRAIEHDIEPA
jgi:hypothetical protein